MVSRSSSGSVLPIIYAMRAGKKWESITILLIGAFSKYVNSLQEGEERTKDQISTLKMLRELCPQIRPRSQLRLTQPSLALA